jgi:hypothetical protein
LYIVSFKSSLIIVFIFLFIAVNGLDAKFKASIAKRYEAERGSGDTGKPGGESASGSAQGKSSLTLLIGVVCLWGRAWAG